jgi:hypothetical protein
LTTVKIAANTNRKVSAHISLRRATNMLLPIISRVPEAEYPIGAYPSGESDTSATLWTVTLTDMPK